jgi:tetratricopeptide (TPR) repeat protein
LLLAEASLAIGRLDRARTAIEALLCAAPPAAEASAARALLMETYCRQGAFRLLAEMMEVEAACHRNRRVRLAALLLDAAGHLTKLGDVREAVRLLDLARRADRTNPAVYAKLAAALESLGMWDALAEVLAEHVAVHGHRRGAECASIRVRLAGALVRLGRMGDALEHLSVAAKLSPTDSHILRRRAALELATGDVDAAERTCRAALLAASGAVARIEIYVELSRIAIRRRDRSRAESLLETALEAAIDGGHQVGFIEEALRAVERYDLLARALSHRCVNASKATERAEALGAFARVWREHLRSEPALAPQLGAHVRLVARATSSNIASSWSVLQTKQSSAHAA